MLDSKHTAVSTDELGIVIARRLVIGVMPRILTDGFGPTTSLSVFGSLELVKDGRMLCPAHANTVTSTTRDTTALAKASTMDIRSGPASVVRSVSEPWDETWCRLVAIFTSSPADR